MPRRWLRKPKHSAPRRKACKRGDQVVRLRTVKVLATLLLLLQLGPLAGPVLCHAQMSCGMPQHPVAVTAPGGRDAGLPRGDCSTVQLCSPAAMAVLSPVVQVEPTLYPHDVVLPGGRSLIAGLRAAPPAPPPRAQPALT